MVFDDRSVDCLGLGGGKTAAREFVGHFISGFDSEVISFDQMVGICDINFL